MIRNSLKKEIYQAGTFEGAEAALTRFGEEWNERYSAISEL